MSVFALLDTWPVVATVSLSLAVIAGGVRAPDFMRRKPHCSHQSAAPEPPFAGPLTPTFKPTPTPTRLSTADMARAFGVPPHAPRMPTVAQPPMTIEREAIDPQLANLNDLAMQARIVPAFRDGMPIGFKLFSIRPDSIYSKIGIQNGDVIRRLNGFDINSPDKALEAYSKLRSANHIEVELERQGQLITQTYDLTP